MPETKLHETARLGQSLWLDFINRDLLETGKLGQWIKDGLRGMTSNPSIFHQVISSGTDYDNKIQALKDSGASVMTIYDELTIRDIREACDCFAGVNRETEGLDGYVSLEIDPRLAADTKASIAEGQRLFKAVDRPNCMIKVPATAEGFPVIEELIASGINVNVTLIFSLAQYEKTVNSYIKGLKRLAESGGDLKKVRSVASVFISRIDSTVDKLLDQKGLTALKGKAAVANAQRIFARSAVLFALPEFKALAEKGAHVQRVLWGSTSTKDPSYSDVKYVDELIGSPTVNTVPEKTLKAFMDHGTPRVTLGTDPSAAEKLIGELAAAGIDIDAVCARLLADGVKAFVQAFDELIRSIETKANALAGRK